MKKHIKLVLLLVLLVCIVFFTYPVHQALGKGYLSCDGVRDVYITEDMNYLAINDSGASILSFTKDADVQFYMEQNSLIEAGFNKTNCILGDSEGKIYVQNMLNDEEAISWGKRENVKCFNKFGLYSGTFLDQFFDRPQLNDSILELTEADGEVYAIKRDNKDIYLTNIVSGEARKYLCPEAESVNAAVYDVSSDTVYAQTRDGRIYKCSKSGYNEIFNQLNGYEDCTFYSFFVYENEVYLSDLWTNVLYKIVDGELLPLISFEEKVYGFSNVRNGQVVCNSVYGLYLLNLDSMEYTQINEFKQNPLIRLCAGAFYLALFLALIIISFLLIWLVRFILKRVEAKTKTMLGLSVVVAIMTLCFCCLVFKNIDSLLIDNMVSNATSEARITASLIDANNVNKIRSVTDYRGSDYNRIKEICEAVIFEKDDVPGPSYVMIYTLEDDGQVVVRYSTEEAYGCNLPYVWSDGTDEAYVYDNATELVWNNAAGDGGNYIGAYFPIMSTSGRVVGVLEIGCDRAALNSKIASTMFSISISIFVLAIVFVLIFLEIYEFHEGKKLVNLADLESGSVKPPLKIYRAIVFLVFFVTNITTPFLSIYALKLAESAGSSYGMSAGVVAAIPIAAEVVFGAIFSMTGGRILDILGNHKAGILGGALFTVGLAIRFFYPGIWILTIGNAIQGAGWGIVLLIVNTRIASEKDEELQEAGFSDYNAASQNGINSGVVTGGFLLLFFKYNDILIIATILSTLVLWVCSRYIKDIEATGDGQVKNKASRASIIAFIKSPRIISYYILIVIPVIAASYFLNFLYPIIADSIGVEESLIGYSYLLNGLVVICFGNVIVNKLSKKYSKKVLLAMASLIYAIVFIAVGLFTNIYSLIFALIALAVSDSFGYVVQSTIYTEMKETEQLGYDRAMGVYSLIENSSQAIGSFLFGYILTVGVTGGMVVYGIVIGVTGILFALLYKQK